MNYISSLKLDTLKLILCSFSVQYLCKSTKLVNLSFIFGGLFFDWNDVREETIDAGQMTLHRHDLGDVCQVHSNTAVKMAKMLR